MWSLSFQQCIYAPPVFIFWCQVSTRKFAETSEKENFCSTTYYYCLLYYFFNDRSCIQNLVYGFLKWCHRNFMKFLACLMNFSKAEQEKTLKNQASNMPPKKEAKFLLKIHFQILPLPPFFGLFPGTRFITKYYSFHRGLVVHTNLSIQIFNGLGWKATK